MTVDRLAALEARAREIADRSIDARVCCDKYPACQTELWRVALAMDIAASLTAAASEARAAAIAECAAICDLYEDDLRKVSKVKPYVGDKVKYDSAANMVGGCATATRALATPAQPEGN